MLKLITICRLLDIVGINHEVWKTISDELSNDKIKVTPASIRVSVAKRKSEFLNYTEFTKNNENNDGQENVHSK